MPRAHYQPSEALQEQIWPWLAGWEERFTAAAQGKGAVDGGLDQDDLAGMGFLKLLRQLRIILLQDMAVLREGKSAAR